MNNNILKPLKKQKQVPNKHEKIEKNNKLRKNNMNKTKSKNKHFNNKNTL